MLQCLVFVLYWCRCWTVVTFYSRMSQHIFIRGKNYTGYRVEVFSSLIVFAVFVCIIIVVSHYSLLQNIVQKKLIFYEFHENETQQCSKVDKLNVSYWYKDVSQRTFVNLVHFPKFPFYPDGHYCARSLSSVGQDTQQPCIKRIQTNLGPVESGFYQFRVRSSVALRLFLTTGPQASNFSLVLETKGEDTGIVFSKSYLLESHFSFEMIVFCLPGENYVNIEWLVPGSTQFSPIQTRDLISGDHVGSSEQAALHAKENPNIFPPNEHSLLAFIPGLHITRSFPTCSSINLTAWTQTAQEISVFTPFSNTNSTRENNGNNVASNAKTDEVLKFITDALQKTTPAKYPSHKIRKIETTQSKTEPESWRLLVDLDMIVDGLDYIERLSEYFFAFSRGNKLKLCRPFIYRWSRFVTLNFVFLAHCYQTEAVWANYFIANMIELLRTTLDVNLKVIITTCDGQHVRNYDSRLRSSGFDRYAVVVLESDYLESHGMKAALSVVEEDNSIVVLCDSRVHMPIEILEEIRKHTFESTMAYSPVPYQLDVGYYPGSETKKGYWCPQCSGLLALYKKDWEGILASKDGRGNNGFLKEKMALHRHISNAEIEIVQVKINNLYRF